MQRGTNAKSEIIALLEGRPEEFLQRIRQFILDVDEREYIDFLYPLDPAFAGELEEYAAGAKAILENLRDIEGTLRDLDSGKIKIQRCCLFAAATLRLLIRRH
jgi:hypothetical protein